jgi:hypothetical protein
MPLLMLELPDTPPWGQVAVPLDQPRGVVAVDEAAHGLAASVPTAGWAPQDDRAVVGTGFAAAPNPLGRQQPLAPKQPQDPFAADVHAVLATEPGPDLAVALAGERGVLEHSADQPDQLHALIEVAGPGRPGGSAAPTRRA